MRQTKILIFTTCFLVFLAFAQTSLFAQPESARPPIEPTYEVSLQVLVGSNDAAQNGDLPQNLSSIARQLKANFTFSNYRLENTYLGRVGNGGNFEYKSVSNILGSGIDTETPSFLEWTLGGLRYAANGKGQTVYQAQSLRFGARIPIRTSSVTAEGGKTISAVNYESIGLATNRVGVSENIPTLIGSLSLPKTSGTLFLVMTVRPTQE